MAQIPITQLFTKNNEKQQSDKTRLDKTSTDLYQNFNNISISLSTKESGYYSSLESETSITIFPEQQGGKKPLRKYINVGLLRNAAGTQQVAHNIGIAAAYFTTRIFRIFGTAYKSGAPVRNIPLPYPSATAADVIEMYVDNQYINIVVGKDMSAYTAYVCIEYLL